MTSSRPRRWATVTASVRLETLSLVIRLLRCTLAVFSLMNRLLADLAVGHPLGDEGENLLLPPGEHRVHVAG